MAGLADATAAGRARHPLTSKEGWAAFVAEAVTDNRTMEERLQAARSNNRFADRRIAQLADPQGVT